MELNYCLYQLAYGKNDFVMHHFCKVPFSKSLLMVLSGNVLPMINFHLQLL